MEAVRAAPFEISPPFRASTEVGNLIYCRRWKAVVDDCHKLAKFSEPPICKDLCFHLGFNALHSRKYDDVGVLRLRYSRRRWRLTWQSGPEKVAYSSRRSVLRRRGGRFECTALSSFWVAHWKAEPAEPRSFFAPRTPKAPQFRGETSPEV
jgi:hypothetical protein